MLTTVVILLAVAVVAGLCLLSWMLAKLDSPRTAFAIRCLLCVLGGSGIGLATRIIEFINK